MMKRRIISSKKLFLLTMMIFAVPFTAFLFSYNFYMVNILDRRIADANLSRVEFYQTFLEDDLHAAEKFMANLVANDGGYGRLRYKLSSLDAHLFTVAIMEKYRDVLATQKNVGAFFIYTPQNELYRKVYRSDIPSSERETVDEYLRELIQTNEQLGQQGWFLNEIEGKYYLFRVLGGNSVYTIGMVDLDRILLPGSPIKDSEDEILLYTDANGNPLSSLDVVHELDLSLKGSEESFYTSGTWKRYFIVQSFSVYAGIHLAYAVPYKYLLGQMDPLILSLLIASVVFILLLLLCFLLLQRNFFAPMSELVRTMGRIRRGNMEAKMKLNGNIAEFHQVGEVFNAMMEETKQLKIMAYEQKLEMQQARLHYLQIQIRPHFFQNCLKNLYALAEAGNFKRLQEMILVLSKYMRSMIQENAATISLANELENVETYLLLQQMSLSVPISSVIDVEPVLRDISVPPLSILTFVENAVKHAITPHSTLKIHVKIMLLQDEDGGYINISVRDNGPGFSDEMLQLLNGPIDVEALTQQHIGIANVRRRFELIYKGRSTFFFERNGGSCVEIFIPYQAEALDALNV